MKRVRSGSRGLIVAVHRVCWLFLTEGCVGLGGLNGRLAADTVVVFEYTLIDTS